MNPDMLPGGCAAMTTGSMETRIVAGVVPDAGETTIDGCDAVALHDAFGSTAFVMRIGSEDVTRTVPSGCRAAPKLMPLGVVPKSRAMGDPA